MNNYAIRFEIEFHTRTIAGLTECKVEKTIHRNFKDFDVVEEITNYFNKILSKNDFQHIQITACFEKDYSTIESVNRLCKDWNGTDVELIVWHNNGAETDVFKEQKATKKYIRNWYLDIVSRLYFDYIDNPFMNDA